MLNKKINNNTNNNTKHSNAVMALSGNVIKIDKNKIIASINKKTTCVSGSILKVDFKIHKTTIKNIVL